MTPAPVTDIKPQQQTPAPGAAKSVYALAIAALLLPCLGLLVLYIFADSKSFFWPFLGANLLVLAALVLCWVAIKNRGLAKAAPVIVAAILGVCILAFFPKHDTVDTIKYGYAGNAARFSSVQSAGMSFSKPTEFTSTNKKSDQNYSTESFAHQSTTGYPLGFIFTFSYKDSHTNDKKYVQGVNDFMSGAVKNQYRTEYINAIKKQVFDSYPGYSATMSEPQKFTGANIKNNAWSFDLDVTSNNPQVKPMKGKIVYALGNGTIYYFALMVTGENWAPNMSAWQAVLGSLKLGA